MLKDNSNLLELLERFIIMVFVVVLIIISIGNYNIVLTKLTAEIWQHSDIMTTKSYGARNMSSHFIKQIVNNPIVYPDYQNHFTWRSN